MRLDPEDQLQASIDSRQDVERHLTRSLQEVVAVQRDDLRDVGNRVLRQSRTACRDEDVAGRFQERDVGRDHHAQHGTDTAAVEGFGLDDEDRSPEARTGPDGLTKVSPPDLTSLDYHSIAATLRAWALSTSEAT